MARATCEFNEKVPTGAHGVHTYYFRCTWDEGDRNSYLVQANGASLEQALALALERVPYDPPHRGDD
jgi:hypothetical protein